ncbi:MAG: Arylsulfatase [Phycisphaerae bacterium]|nr:Arylsulfatase [Phycisphaerae bacterium]
MRSVFCAIAVGVGLAGAGCSRPGASGPPADSFNVLVVTLDTTRADHLGCYGYDQPTSATIDALAADGVRFEWAYSTAGCTPVAHASMFSGLDPYKHHLRVIGAPSGNKLPEEIPTLATVLAEAGWKTGAFLSSFTVSEYFGLHRGYEKFDNGLLASADDVFKVDPQTGNYLWEVRRFQRRSDETTDSFLRWLPTVEKSPFFAWIHYWDPHDPMMVPPKEVMARFAPPANSDEKAVNRARYDAEIFYMDAQLGRVIEALKQKGLYERTIIVVIADHGEGLGDHGWMYHRLLYQEQMRVPFIVRAPGGPRGVGVPQIVRCIDLYPTVLDLLGLAWPEPIQGVSLRPLWERKPDGPRTAYADQLNAFDMNSNVTEQRPQDGLIYALVDGDWKLIYHDRAPEAHELFNLREDPRELQNVFAARADVANRLIDELRARNCIRPIPFPPGQMSKAEMDALAALGYASQGESTSRPATATTTSAPSSRRAP